MKTIVSALSLCVLLAGCAPQIYGGLDHNAELRAYELCKKLKGKPFQNCMNKHSPPPPHQSARAYQNQPSRPVYVPYPVYQAPPPNMYQPQIYHAPRSTRCTTSYIGGGQTALNCMEY